MKSFANVNRVASTKLLINVLINISLVYFPIKQFTRIINMYVHLYGPFLVIQLTLQQGLINNININLQ